MLNSQLRAISVGKERKMIKIQCDKCGARFRVTDENAGKVAFCRKCQNKIPIPGTFQPAPEPAPVEQAPEKEVPQWKKDRIKRAKRNKWVVILLFVTMIVGITVGLWIVKPWEGGSTGSDSAKVEPIVQPKPFIPPIVQPPKPVITPPVTIKPKPKPVITPPTPQIPDLEVFEEKLDWKDPNTLFTQIVANKAGEYLISCRFTDAVGNLLTYTETDGTTGIHATKSPVQVKFEKDEKKAVSFPFEKPVPLDKDRRFYYKISWDPVDPPADAATQPKSNN